MITQFQKYADFCSVLLAPGAQFPDYTPSKTVFEDDTVKLRKYGDGSNTPSLIVNPKAGHGRLTDHGPGQSLVRTVLSSVGGPVFELDWKTCNLKNRFSMIDDLIKRIMVCASFIDRPFRIIGLCAGGWMSAIYAALFPEKISEIVTIGAPIDFTAGGGDIQEFVQNAPPGFFDLLVRLGGGVMRGEWMLAAWKGRNWVDRCFTDYWNWWQLAMEPECKEKRAKIEKVRRYRRWYETSIDLGGWYAQACEGLFRANKLIKGELEVFGQRVNLKRITQPWTRIWGTKDDITLRKQAFFNPIFISTPVEQIRDVEIAGVGHIGCFLSEKSQPVVAGALGGAGNHWQHWRGEDV